MVLRSGSAVTFGPASGAKALVLYDTGGSFAAQAEMYGLAAAHLATHFGRVTIKPALDYTRGEATSYDALLYVGSDYLRQLPTALIDDVVGGTTSVVWAGANVRGLAAGTGGDDQPLRRAQFAQRYGWDPLVSVQDDQDLFGAVRYKGRDLARDGERDKGGLVVPHLTDPAKVTVLAEAVCGVPKPGPCVGADATVRAGATTVPWAIRSANLTYIAEAPFSYMTEGGHYLAYADLLYDALGRDRDEVRQAAVRLEDVSPNSDPDTIRRYADYLSGEGVPFQIAVIPNFVDPNGSTLAGEPRNLTLADRPKLVSALTYAQSRGGVLVQHGTTHQRDTLDNPYSAASGDDFEFFKAGCSSSPNPPYEIVECEEHTDVQLLGPLDGESEDADARRIAGGRGLFERAGLAAPTLFETPHYTASPAAYRAIRRVYGVRYERGLYTDGLLSGRPSTGYIFDQYFPYSVTDVFGGKVLPENLGSFAPRTYSGHRVRTSADIVAAARANLVVRESTASFFFHPFLPLEHLREIVTGIKAAGYTFVPAEKLR
ncbi:MAG: polysaccharide deacetylase family protein [Austwickia sp.]|nr:polysaccharide deacetylase family protein [Austwickia sp.]